MKGFSSFHPPFQTFAWRYAILALGILAVATVSAAAEEVRSRTLFNPGTDRARDLVIALNPATTPPAGSEVSVYLPVRFAYDSDQLSDVARRNLATIAEALSAPELAGVRFIVEGHTDATGSAVYNHDLSLRRASSALGYLASRGVDLSRLIVQGRGESDPLPSVDPTAAEQRRVEIVRMF